ncbi:MAG: alanine dehydrogenase [Armatimonadota bacterium]|nr:alanine dehydrogenase [Armatimonadota bacterium]
MIIGVPKEIKPDEYRVGMVPDGVELLTKAGHTVLVEKSAGRGASIRERDYEVAGATVVHSAEEIYKGAEMIVKVKEPLPQEYLLIREGQVIFTFFHFAASRELTLAMIESKAVCIAYETTQSADGSLPILTPMSEVAGRMAIQEGAKYLERPMEGRGILLAGVPGVPPATVLILGAGTVGSNAARVAAGIGANVIVMDTNLDRLRHLADVMPPNVTTIYSNAHNIRAALPHAHLVIGAVLKRGARSPTLITRDMLKLMMPRSVIVDVAVDQGGSVETCRPTTHSQPVFIEEDVVHYCVTNMPGAVAGTSAYALTNVTGGYVLKIANHGYAQAMREDPGIRSGLNIAFGKVVLPAIAEQFGLPCVTPESVLKT